MKFTVKLIAVGAALALGVPQLQADQTNLVQQLSIHLLGMKQGVTITNGFRARTTIDTVRVSTRDVITALGTATGNSFSPEASLVVVSPLPSSISWIQVRDGANSVDVTGYFNYQTLSDSVSRSELNLRTGRGSGTDFSIQRFALLDAGWLPALSLHFDVSGMATETYLTDPPAGTRSELEASVAGAGDEAGVPMILQGSVRVHGYQLEVTGGGGTT